MPFAKSERGQIAVTLALLAGLLFLVYLTTYSGAPLTDDERRIIDTTDSFAVRGSLLLNETAYLDGLLRTSVEPAQPVLSVPLYWIAYHLPWVGNVHALYLFAPLVTALAAAVLYLFARSLGYTNRVAVIAALLFGLGTIVWPYTKTYFREPLNMLLILSAAFLAHRWREAFNAERSGHWSLLAAFIVVTLFSLLSKEAAIIALPALAAYALPQFKFLVQRRRQIIPIAITLIAIAAAFVVAVTVLPEMTYSLATRYEFGQRLVRFQRGITQAGPGILGYLFSPGKGIWWYSPILLLALAAPRLLPRTRWRESWLPLGLALWFVVAYATVRGEQWQGGTGWGARYMVPIIPFLMLAALPAIERLLSGGWRSKLALGLLALLSIGIQAGGAYVYLYDYEQHLVIATGLPPFDKSLVWQPRWSQAIGSLLYLGQAQTDIRWLLDGIDGLTLVLLAAGIAGMATLLIRQINRKDLPTWKTVGGALVLAIGLAGVAMVRAYDDPRYLADRADLEEVRRYLDEHADPGDIIVLSSPAYVAHFMNYYKGPSMWYSLPLAPGERYSPEQAPSVISDDPEELAGPIVTLTLSLFVSEREFSPEDHLIWLVGDLTPWAHPWSTRPAERLMTRNLYRVSTQDFSETVRLTSYLTYNVDRDEQPQEVLNVRLGESIQLNGFDLVKTGRTPLGETASPGDLIGLSLVWKALATPNTDYTVAVFLIGPDGLPVLQQDLMPAGDFRPTTSWQPRQIIRDNYGFVLPLELPAGTYQIWVVMYDWRSGDRLPVTGPDGEDLGDHVVLKDVEIVGQ